jgi:hypothetical protein
MSTVPQAARKPSARISQGMHERAASQFKHVRKVVDAVKPALLELRLEQPDVSCRAQRFIQSQAAAFQYYVEIGRAIAGPDSLPAVIAGAYQRACAVADVRVAQPARCATFYKRKSTDEGELSFI